MDPLAIVICIYPFLFERSPEKNENIVKIAKMFHTL